MATGKGLKNTAETDRKIWARFGSEPAEVRLLAAQIRASDPIQSRPAIEPDGDGEDFEFVEGRTLTRIHTARERSRHLRQKVLKTKSAQGPLTCECCGIRGIRANEKLEGAIFEVHHLLPLAELGQRVTRLSDVCLRQSPEVGRRLISMPGVVSADDIEAANRDWPSACDRMFIHGTARAKEIQRIARVHRDPFEPILPILESASPVGAYRAITEEVLRQMPKAGKFPRQAAEAVRSYLMLRLGLHLGVRQRNLRELLIQRRGQQPTREGALEARRKGELRWSSTDDAWEVFIPAAAFKNSASSYFAQKPYRLILPRLGRLYEFIDSYLEKHRAVLLAGATDPGTFFVKTVKRTSTTAAYDQSTFYEAWRLTIERYGIYNPHTGRGAVKGLLPHGPHSVRDVLATHVLKQTGSYEQAGYAIQDTAKTVADHYGRFLPQDKAALAARVLNQAWET